MLLFGLPLSRVELALVANCSIQHHDEIKARIAGMVCTKQSTVRYYVLLLKRSLVTYGTGTVWYRSKGTVPGTKYPPTQTNSPWT